MPCKGLTTNMSAFYIRDVTQISSKYNKYAGNQTARDLFWLFFFYFPMKVVEDHVHNSQGGGGGNRAWWLYEPGSLYIETNDKLGLSYTYYNFTITRIFLLTSDFALLQSRYPFFSRNAASTTTLGLLPVTSLV